VRISHIVGARPNLIKAAPVIAALSEDAAASQVLVHTGQHYDHKMSKVFFEELGLPEPDVNLGVGSGSHAVQTAEIMMRFEKVVLEERPDWVVVYGDVNSTVAAAIVAAKLQVPIAHVEAGLRSFDRTMPEEINRVLTDQLASLLFTSSKDADENLVREGIPEERIRLVGNVMIDTLRRVLPSVAMPRLDGLAEKYALVTLHRPANVDEPAELARLVDTLIQLSEEIQILFPIHPRTRGRLDELGIDFPQDRRFLLFDPFGYRDFLALQEHATVVITDSGGIQEETTVLGVPCLTVRENTERPVTVEMGTNILVGRDMTKLKSEVERALAGDWKQGAVPPLWDGKAGERIAKALRHVG